MALALATFTPALLAEEGKWTPQQVLQLDAKWLKRQGLDLPVSRLWDPQRGTGLLSAAVSVPGCSAAFVSKTGLVLTNHHCLFSLIQEHSTPQRDLITNGFIAHSREEELEGKTMRVTVPHRFTDVTQQITAVIAANADDVVRSKAVENKQKEIIAGCEKVPGHRCNVAAFDGGLQYILSDGVELTDIRLVYAPPRALGEFGGEIDNFRWPRHVGDFAMARAYLDGKPYQPEFFFPIVKDGVKPGSFVMLMGYPGRTFRSLTAIEMENERDFRFRLMHEIYGAWIHLIETTSKGSAEGSIATAATLKSLNNSHTNSEGQMAGLARGNLIEHQRDNDDAVARWAQGKSEFEKALAAKAELDRLAQDRRRTAVRDYLYSIIPAGSLALRHSVLLVRLARERLKPDAEREPGYQARDFLRLRNVLERDERSYFAPTDIALLDNWLERVNREPGVPAGLKGMDARRLLADTRVTDTSERLKMFEETPDQLRARNDAMLNLAFVLEPALEEYRRQIEARDGAVARLRPEWRRAVIAHAGKPVAPDANATLRVSFAHVKGYAPSDGVFYTPQTTLAGMIAKDTGEEPFALPEFIRAAAKKFDAASIPVDFLADADTTGGNSGSPVVNGRGELVGLNFDRVWENVANDFGYNPDVARNISVDIRFFVWLLRDVQGATEIVRELGLER